MIMQSGRFSSGGGGGSNRDVVFTARVAVDPRVKQTFDGLRKEIDGLQRQMNGLRIPGVGGGGFGGAAGAGGGAAAGRGGAPSVLLTDSSYERQQRSFFDRALREEQRAVKQGIAERARDLRNLKKDTKDTLEGIIGLTRAFVLFGVASEENLEKAVRALAKFEGAVAGFKGGLKLSEGLGGLLGRAAPKLGMAAGAGTTALGAAGIAAGVGLLGGGLAIRDQINYWRTGQIGAYSQGHADIGTRLARFDRENVSPYLNGGIGVSALRQLGQPFYDRAEGDMRYERGAVGFAQRQGNLLVESDRRLANERQILALMEREVAKIREASEAANARLKGAAFAYEGLSSGDKKDLAAAFERYKKDPNSISSRVLQNMMPFGGASFQSGVSGMMQKRASGFIDQSGAFNWERDAQMKAAGSERVQAQLQREFVVKLQVENQQFLKGYEEALANALAVANEELRKSLDESTKKILEDRQRIQMNFQNQMNSLGNSFGG